MCMNRPKKKQPTTTTTDLLFLHVYCLFATNRLSYLYFQLATKREKKKKKYTERQISVECLSGSSGIDSLQIMINRHTKIDKHKVKRNAHLPKQKQQNGNSTKKLYEKSS